MGDEFDEQEDLPPEEDIEEQELDAEMSDAEREAEERVTKNQLNRLLTKVRTKRIVSITNPEDRKLMKKARKMGAKFAPDLMQIEVARAINVQKTVSAAISSTPALYYILLIAIIIFLAIVIAVVLFSSFSFLFGQIEGDNDSTASSAFGVTGTDFYGVRVAYQNESLAATQMIENYVNMVVSGAEDIQQTTSANVGGTQYALQLTLNFELPTEYDYSNFEEASFSATYSIVYNASFDVAKNIYKHDNEADFVGSSLVECAKDIKYFGYANVEALAEIIVQVLLDNTTIQATQNSEVVTNSATINEIKNELQQVVASKLSDEFASLEVRAEKLFVKDIILSEDEMVSGITKENYVYYMFMPKRQVNFTSFSFMVGGQDLQNFEISANYGGANYVINVDGENLGDDTNFAYIYSTNNINISVNAFADIDTNNLQALSEPMSVFEIVTNNSLNTDLYLQINIVGENSFYALKTNGFTVTTYNLTPFVIAEFETLWS